MIQFALYSVIVLGLQTSLLHGSWRCHYDEVLWVDPEITELLPGATESISYYGWGFILHSDGKGVYNSIGENWENLENYEFQFSRIDSLLVLDNSTYIIETLKEDTLIFKTIKNSQSSFTRRYHFHKE